MFRIVFMGTPDFAVPSLAVVAASEDVVAVYTQPDRPSGRGRHVELSAVKREAVARGIAVYQPHSLRRPSDVVEELRALKPDLIVVAAYGLILPQSVLDAPAHGCLNVHASLLPKYRGASPVASALLSGETETGVSIMLMDAGMDTGPLLAQRALDIDPMDTSGALEAKLSQLGAELLGATLPRWISGDVTPQPQDDAVATVTRLITKQDGHIRWSVPAERVAQMVRAYTPWPGAYTSWQGQPLKLLAAQATPERGEPGLVYQRQGRVLIGAGDSSVRVDRLQLAGKRPMDPDDFIRGHREFIGALLGEGE